MTDHDDLVVLADAAGLALALADQQAAMLRTLLHVLNEGDVPRDRILLVQDALHDLMAALARLRSTREFADEIVRAMGSVKGGDGTVA